jgi:hypothetical protein
METSKHNKYLNFAASILGMPLWIKEVIYIQLRKDLNLLITEDFLDSIENRDIFQLIVPKLTYKGKKEVENREKNLSQQVYKFLEEVTKEYKIVEMVINNFWTLEECAKYYVECIENELINKPSSPRLLACAQYLSGKIRLGEYFTRTEKITLDQLNEALIQQQQIQDSTGDKIGIAVVLMNKGFVTEKDIQSLLKIKDESKKRFIFNLRLDTFEAANLAKTNDTALQEQLTQILKENKILKEQLRKILNIKK